MVPYGVFMCVQPHMYGIFAMCVQPHMYGIFAMCVQPHICMCSDDQNYTLCAFKLLQVCACGYPFFRRQIVLDCLKWTICRLCVTCIMHSLHVDY